MGCDYCSGYTPPPPPPPPSCSTCDHLCYGFSCVCNGPCYGYGPISRYRVQIDSTGTIDTIKWSSDGGVNWNATLIPIISGWITLNNGVKIKFDDVTGHTVNDYWDFYAGDGVFAGERLIYYYKAYGGTSDLLYHSFHPGSSGQSADQALQNEIKDWKETMRYTAYSYFRLIYDVNAWKSIPDFTAVLKGRKLYDPRNGLTAFSRNPALVWLDFLSTGRYSLGITQSSINIQSVKDVANWCDANGFNFDGAILDRQDFIDNFEDIMMNFCAFTVYSEGIYYLKVFTDDAPGMSLDENDIEIAPEAFAIDQPGIPESPNKAVMTFADKDKNYTTNYGNYEDLAGIGLDGQSRVKEMTLIGTNNMTQSTRLAKYCVMRNKWNKTFPVIAHPRCFELEPGDTVAVTHEFPGWSAKKLRIKDVGYPMEGRIPLTLMEENSLIYT
jgi:hypothetical protein